MSKVQHDDHQGATESHRLSAEGCELKTMPWSSTAQESNTSVCEGKVRGHEMQMREKKKIRDFIKDLLCFYTAESISSGVG